MSTDSSALFSVPVTVKVSPSADESGSVIESGRSPPGAMIRVGSELSSASSIDTAFGRRGLVDRRCNPFRIVTARTVSANV